MKADYYGGHGTKYDDELEFPGRSWTSIAVLPFLVGRQWDDIALAYCHALRPEMIRVIRPGVGQKLDGYTSRITVYVDAENYIKSVDQEVEVGIPDLIEGIEDGYTLDLAVGRA